MRTNAKLTPTRVAVGAALAVLTLSLAALGRQPAAGDGRPTVAAVAGSEDQTPEPLWAESIAFHHDGLQRVLGISRGQLGSGQKTAAAVQLYFVAPEFSLIPKSPPLPDVGPLVHTLKRANGRTNLEFRFRLNSAEVDQLAQEIVTTSPTEARFREAAKKSVVKLRREEVLELVVVCRRAGDRDPLAVSDPRVVTAAGGVVQVFLPFDDANLARFRTAYKQGLVEFTPVYSSAGQNIETLQETVTVTAEMFATAARRLSSAQRDGTHPVLQQTVDEVVRELTVVVQESRRASSKRVLELAEADSLLVGAVVERSQTLAFKDLYAFPEFGPQALAANLKPLVDELNRSAGRQVATVHTIEGGAKHAESSGGGFNLVFSADVDSQQIETFVASIESKTGMKFRVTNSKREYAPHEVQVRFLAKGKDRQSAARFRSLQFDAGGNRTPVVPAAVPQWFTTELVGQQTRQQFDARVAAQRPQDRIRQTLERIDAAKQKLEADRKAADGLRKSVADLRAQLQPPKAALDQEAARYDRAVAENKKLDAARSQARQDLEEYKHGGYYRDANIPIP